MPSSMTALRREAEAAAPRPPFAERLAQAGVSPRRRVLRTLQVNLGKRCNQACLHCHVEAGPNRTESMSRETVDRILTLLAGSTSIDTVDITGGAPEINPNFRHLVSEARALGLAVMDRCNLTVLAVQGQEDTAAFLRDHGVTIIASLPCYSQANVDRQRGKGVFAQSIAALRQLNTMGYGQPGSGLELNLVYNPGGPSLPPAQGSLEADYKRRLEADFGVFFNHLFTLTNMPISRFLWDLERAGRLEAYMALLVESFNPAAAEGVMCRELLSVSWDGRLFDCDFNQMLEMPVVGPGRSVWDIETLSAFDGERIAFDDHCYGCTAGAGSSCGGALS